MPDPRLYTRRSVLKTGLFAGAGLIGASVLPACSSSNSSSGGGGTTGSLSYPTWMLGEAGVGDYWRATASAFESSHPGVKLNFTDIPADQYPDKITTQLAAGTTPDILPIFTNQIYQLIDNNLLEPLDDRLAKTSWVGNEAPLFKAGAQGGKHYGVVLTASPWSLIYNQKLLKAAGVSVPTTPERFLAACQTVKAKTGQYGLVLPTDPAQTQNAYITTLHFVLGYGSDWANANATPTADAPATIQGMTLLQQLIDSNVMPRGMQFNDARNLFKDGKAAFTIDVPTTMTLVKTKNPDLYPYCGYAANPTPTKAAVTGGAFFVLPKNAKHKDLAWDYISMVNQASWQNRWLTQTVQLAGQTITPSADFLKQNPWVTTMIQIAAKYQVGFGYAPPSPKIAPHVAEFQKVVMDTVGAVWNGSQRLEPAMATLQKNLVAWEHDNNITS